MPLQVIVENGISIPTHTYFHGVDGETPYLAAVKFTVLNNDDMTAFQAFSLRSVGEHLGVDDDGLRDLDIINNSMFRVLRLLYGLDTKVIQVNGCDVLCERVGVDVWEVYQGGEYYNNYLGYTTNPFNPPNMLLQIVTEKTQDWEKTAREESARLCYNAACYATDFFQSVYRPLALSRENRVVIYHHEGCVQGKHIPAAFMNTAAMKMHPDRVLYGIMTNVDGTYGPKYPSRPMVINKDATVSVYDQPAGWVDDARGGHHEEVMVYSAEMSGLNDWTALFNWLFEMYIPHIANHLERFHGESDPQESASQHVYNNMRIDVGCSMWTDVVDLCFTMAAIAVILKHISNDDTQWSSADKLLLSTTSKSPSFALSAETKVRTLMPSESSTYDDVLTVLKTYGQWGIDGIESFVAEHVEWHDEG